MCNPPLVTIDENLTGLRIGNFVRFKYPVLATQKPETLCITYTYQQFLDLLAAVLKVSPGGAVPTGLRVYFASYVLLPAADPNAANNNPLVPKGMEDTLTVVFAPTIRVNPVFDGLENDLGGYFAIDFNSGNVVNLTTIDNTIFPRWRQNYITNKWTPLNNIVQTLPPVGSKSETKSMWYESTKIADLYQYFQCMGAASLPTVNLYFAAYNLDPVNGNDVVQVPFNAGPKTFDVGGQLTLVLGFGATVNGYNLYLPFSNPAHNVTTLGGGDTGYPCPPAVC